MCFVNLFSQLVLEIVFFGLLFTLCLVSFPLIANLAWEGGLRGAAPDLLLFHFYIAGKGIRTLLERFTVGCKVDPT